MPVIRNADEKNLLGLSRAIEDLAARARSKKLNPDEVQGGTFTITNPGIFGARLRPAADQPAAGRDPRRRRDREARGRRRRCDRDPSDVPPVARLRSPADRRRGRGPVPVVHQGAAGELRRSDGCRRRRLASSSSPAPRLDRYARRSTLQKQLVEERKRGRDSRSAAAARASATSSRSASRPATTRSNVLATPEALARDRRRAVRDRPRRRRDLSRSRPARRLSDPRSASRTGATCIATCAISRRS